MDKLRTSYLETLQDQPPPLVTIGFPVFNGARHLRQSLDSLLAQTFTDFEIVISDNASNDETAAICAEFSSRDFRIRYIRQPANRGAWANFVFVLEAAAGPYFMWAAADDLWDPDWLAALVPKLRPEVAISFGSTVTFVDGLGRGKRVTLKSLQGSGTIRALRHYFWSEFGSTKSCAIYGLFHTAQVRKLSNEILARDFDCFGLDNIFVFKAMQLGQLVISPEVTFYKRNRKPTEPHSDKTISLKTRFLHFRLLATRDLWPYFPECIRQSPPGLVRFVVSVFAPIKYLWLVCRGFAPILGHLIPSRTKLDTHNVI